MDLPINSMVIVHSYVSHYQRVNHERKNRTFSGRNHGFVPWENSPKVGETMGEFKKLVLLSTTLPDLCLYVSYWFIIHGCMW